MKIYSWNINGLRSAIRRGAFEAFINQDTPDIVCLQETKTKPDQIEVDLPDYLEIWNSAARPGYSGTAILTKLQPLNTYNSLTEELQASYDWDQDRYGSPLNEGRVQTLEFEPFYLVNAYTPNSKRDLSRLQLRENLWDPAFLRFLKDLEKHKPVIACGDFNAAHTPLDLARPKDNERHAGFTDEERQGIKNLISAGFIDTFRYFYPSVQRYTWWAQWAKARERNIGWRIDYFFVSEDLLPHLKSAEIHEHILGSDHCPVSIELDY